MFGLTATYVSILRGRVRRDGSAALVRRRGRPPKLSARQVAKARTWAGQGVTQQEIAARLGVVQPVISELVARVSAAPMQQLPAEPIEQAAGEPVDGHARERDVEVAGDGPARAAAVFPGSSRIAPGSYPCRYAGVMPLHAYLDRVDAAGVFATLTGGPARRYGDLGVLTAAMLGFALGTGTIEGAKHLSRTRHDPTEQD